MNPPIEIPFRDWSPFNVASRTERPEPPRSMDTFGGIGDRMRTAAFAELQAREAFAWGAETFSDAPEGLKTAWRGLSLAEDRHLGWLLKRMAELGVSVTERRVSDQLWVSLTSCKTALEFAKYMSSAEERGRKAGVRFYESLAQKDPVTAEIFRKIAEEEVEHIQLPLKYFPNLVGDPSYGLSPAKQT